MRSGKIVAINDYLIEEIINSDKFNILPNGSIMRLFGSGWKEVGKADKEGYRRIWWKGKRLFVHRIVFKKFKGYLAKDLVIHHIDENTANNSIDNLELITHKKNIEYKNRRKERTGK